MPNGTCTVIGCDEPRYRREWCNRHYLRWRRHGDPLGGQNPRGIIIMCTARACCESAIAGRLCKLHYERRRVHGDENAVVKMRRQGMSAYDRVMQRTVADPSGCLVYIGPRNHGGYGTVKVGDRSMGAHRVVLIHHQGLVAGLVAMHSCDNPPCVNIAHLRWGTQDDNIADRVLRRGR